MFYKNLDSLEEISNDFIKKGIYIIPILIFHELYRYSYPIEPYAEFSHTDPKSFLENLTVKLLKFAKSSDFLTLYDLNKVVKKIDLEKSSITKETSKLYISQWKKFGYEELMNESKNLLLKRIPS